MSHGQRATLMARRCEMDLDAWRREQRMTWAALAELIGATSARQARAWGLGYERPSEVQREQIEARTNGVVTVLEQHRVRLDWERKNKRPLAPMKAKARRARRRAA